MGRARELGEVRRLVGVARMVTLTGSGGVGKTRLALEAAVGLSDDIADGVWLVELAALVDPALVPRAVASALAVPEAPGRPLIDSLIGFFQGKRLLLILDNCEHLLSGCSDLAVHVLRACPEVLILATSRERLGVAGEVAWRVPSLAVPDPGSVSGTDEIAAGEAVRLFVARACLAVPDFTLGDRNAMPVAQICQRLDGIPLAIELAAARIRHLSAQQIVDRLDDRFRLLVGGSRGAPTRQQTLRATLDWSYSLLSEPERAVFRRLCVFAGGFNLESAEAVCSSDVIDRHDVLDLLGGLVDKSLVTADAADSVEARYGLLETIRQFGLERLDQSSERDSVQLRHAACFLQLAEEAEPHLVGAPDQTAWLERLERDHGNFRAVLQRAIALGDGETAVRLGAAVYRLWYLRGYLAEGRRWLEQIVACHPAPPAAHAQALRGAGLLAYAAGDYASARTLTERSLDVAVELQDKRLICAALNNLGIILIDQGDYPAAWTRCVEGLALARALNDEPFQAILLNNLGLVALCRGDYTAAVPLLEESLVIAEAKKMLWSIAWSIGNLGNAAFQQGDFAAATSRFRDSLSVARQVGDKRVIAERLEELGWVAGALHFFAAAARLFGAADALRETLGAPMPPANRNAHERSLAVTRTNLGEPAFTSSWQAGRGRGLDDTIAEAMAFDRPTAARVDPWSNALTRREREVALLVADGLSNREIAERLVVSVRTAETHITSVLNKLGQRSRAQLAVWVAEHGLRNDPATRPR